jgi:hypothetical protein
VTSVVENVVCVGEVCGGEVTTTGGETKVTFFAETTVTVTIVGETVMTVADMVTVTGGGVNVDCGEGVLTIVVPECEIVVPGEVIVCVVTEGKPLVPVIVTAPSATEIWLATLFHFLNARRV